MKIFNMSEEEINDLKSSLLNFVRRVSVRGGNMVEVQMLPEVIKFLLDMPSHFSDEEKPLNLEELLS